MFFSIFAHKFSYLSIFCHTRLQFAKTSSIHTFFCFYAAVFIKLKLRPDVACTTSGRSKCYIGTHFLQHDNRWQ